MSPTLRSIRQELQRLQEEIHPRVHLAREATRAAWEALETRLELYDRNAELAASRAAGDLVDRGMKLQEQLRQLRAQVRDDVEDSTPSRSA